MPSQGEIENQNLKAVLGKYGVDNLDELTDMLIKNYPQWLKVTDQITAEQWVNWNAMAKKRTIRQYLRMLVEAKIR